MSSGRSLELYFVDGAPGGMLTAEVFNWTGHVLRIPRIKLAEGLRRREASQTGVYLLLGSGDAEDKAYIGEAEVLRDRIAQHARDKDWWDDVVLVTTAGNALHKAHVKYLESRLIELARDAGRAVLENGNVPARCSLNEAATANMESFLDTLQIVLPAIRVDLLQSGKRPRSRAVPPEGASTAAAAIVFHCNVARHGVAARAEVQGEHFVVKAGSKVRGVWSSKHAGNAGYRALHNLLIATNVIVPGPDGARFSEDYAFASLSAAAAIVTGRSANGRVSWILPDGRTYADWEAEELGAPA